MGDTTKKTRKGPIAFLREVKGEMKKVMWPTWSQTVNHTLIVIAFIAIIAIFLAIVDTIFGVGVKGFIIGDFKEAFLSLFKMN